VKVSGRAGEGGFGSVSLTVNLISEDSRDAKDTNGESFQEEAGAFWPHKGVAAPLGEGFREMDIGALGGRQRGAAAAQC